MENLEKYLIDFQLFNDKEQFESLRNLISSSIKNNNFLLVDNAPIEDINNYYLKLKEFFNLPKNIKDQYSFKKIDQKKYGNIGYVPMYQERAIGAKTSDIKEFFHIGKIEKKDNEFYPENVFPNEIQNFEILFSSFYETLEVIANTLFKFISEEYLKLEQNYTHELIDNSHSILRLIKYPKIKASEKGERASAHTGINLIGLCLPATSEGLEYYLPSNKWVKAPKLKSNQMIINFGEMLSFISDEKIKPTLHRVSNPKEEKNQQRYSIVYFYQPDSNIPLKSNKVPYGLVAGDWLNERLQNNNVK